LKPHLTLGRLARTTGLARASLLHYESLGLLMPAGRSAAGYRLYGPAEIERLRAIRRYRDAGLSLAAICDLLATSAPTTRKRPQPAVLLEARLLELSNEVERLRSQQKLLARILASREFQNVRRYGSKGAWTEMLRRVGFTDDEMHAWHVSFEADSAAEHAAFLKSLGLAQPEIAAIRRWSRQGASES
jgi:MerR family transcriptional regulator, thiopeptide resistance regulator